MRRTLKFLHTLGAVGMMGAMAALLAALTLVPAGASGLGDAGVARMLGAVAGWVLLPSLALTLLAGVLAIAVTPAFHDVGWVWVKAATGVLVFEGGLMAVVGPLQAAAKSGAASLTAHALAAERHSLWLLLAVALANVALGVWRPRFSRSVL